MKYLLVIILLVQIAFVNAQQVCHGCRYTDIKYSCPAGAIYVDDINTPMVLYKTYSIRYNLNRYSGMCETCLVEFKTWGDAQEYRKYLDTNHRRIRENVWHFTQEGFVAPNWVVTEIREKTFLFEWR